MRFAFALFALALIADDSQAIGRRRTRQVESVQWQPSYSPVYSTPAGQSLDALGEVNAARAQRGLRPFIHDPALTRAAEICARLRASHRIAGHTANDFAALEPGVSAAAAGCGALEPSWGFRSCCMWEHWTYAGAATVVGSDGKMYHHLFVR